MTDTEQSTASRPRKRRPPNAGKGRKPGSKNKVGRDVGEAVLRALDKAGGDQYLVNLAKKEPRSFAALLAKLMPTRLTGGDGGPIKTETQPADATLLATMRELGERVRTIGGPVLTPVAPAAEPVKTNGHSHDRGDVEAVI